MIDEIGAVTLLQELRIRATEFVLRFLLCKF